MPSKQAEENKRQYEGLVILSGKLLPDKAKEVVNQIEEVVKREGGAVLDRQDWGKRRLPYAIRKQAEGEYSLWSLEVSPSAVSAVQKRLRLVDDILRTSITLKRPVKAPKRPRRKPQPRTEAQRPGASHRPSAARPRSSDTNRSRRKD